MLCLVSGTYVSATSMLFPQIGTGVEADRSAAVNSRTVSNCGVDNTPSVLPSGFH